MRLQNEWTHVAFTHKWGEMAVFINGQKMTNIVHSEVDSALHNNGPLTLGAFLDGDQSADVLVCHGSLVNLQRNVPARALVGDRRAVHQPGPVLPSAEEEVPKGASVVLIYKQLQAEVSPRPLRKRLSSSRVKRSCRSVAAGRRSA